MSEEKSNPERPSDEEVWKFLFEEHERLTKNPKPPISADDLSQEYESLKRAGDQHELDEWVQMHLRTEAECDSVLRKLLRYIEEIHMARDRFIYKTSAVVPEKPKKGTRNQSLKIEKYVQKLFNFEVPPIPENQRIEISGKMVQTRKGGPTKLEKALWEQYHAQNLQLKRAFENGLICAFQWVIVDVRNIISRSNPSSEKIQRLWKDGQCKGHFWPNARAMAIAAWRRARKTVPNASNSSDHTRLTLREVICSDPVYFDGSSKEPRVADFDTIFEALRHLSESDLKE